jgi:hypothetical protein
MKYSASRDIPVPSVGGDVLPLLHHVLARNAAVAKAQVANVDFVLPDFRANVSHFDAGARLNSRES